MAPKNRFQHISPDTLNVALKRLPLKGIEHFTVHDSSWQHFLPESHRTRIPVTDLEFPDRSKPESTVPSNQSQPNTSPSDFQSAPLMRMPTVMRWTGLARSTIYRLIAEDKFPPPVVLATRAVAWRRADLERWSEARPMRQEEHGCRRCRCRRCAPVDTLPSSSDQMRYKSSEDSIILTRFHNMSSPAGVATQRTQALALLRQRGMTRLSEFHKAGVTATTVSRMERAGDIVRLARGLYQLPDAALDTQQSLAEVARLVPKGVICLASALAFHELTDHMPPHVWIAIGRKDWRPRLAHPPIRIARFPDKLLERGVEHQQIAGTPVPVFGVAKTVADLFRYRRTVGDALAIEGLRNALRRRKATPAELAREAEAGGVWRTMEPCVMALTSDA